MTTTTPAVHHASLPGGLPTLGQHAESFIGAVGPSILERNLAALGVTSPRIATQIAEIQPRTDVEFLATPSGHLSATLTDWGPMGTVTRSLASKKDPVVEASRLADKVNVMESPIVAVVGFGLGYHVGQIATRLGRHGITVAFEPDVALLRAVFERIDCSEWMDSSNFLLITDADDEGAIAEVMRGMEGAIAMGVQVIEHPASMPRLADMGGGPDTSLGSRFVQRFTKIVKAARTTIVTTMVQTESTLRNLTQNLDVYAISNGIADLAGTAKGKPAIVVSAGPSLKRNIEFLSRPGVRDRFVIIAVQTVLKPLLARGIKPHFVTALDFHEISKRFYEGLAPADVEGVTLIIEPKVNPAVPQAFPGAIRCVGDAFLDGLLGKELARPMGMLMPGATVAHLAYYFARHLACDPVILMGQDLGFTDGQYYAGGAAIHDSWAGELNEFNTLEMLEWERIVRMRAQLRRETDVLGRAIYTDEQMSTYLVQFQRDFKIDADRGLRTIDATEGGVAKAHTTSMPLEHAISQFGAASVATATLPLPLPLGDSDRRQKLSRTAERVRQIRRDVWKVGEHCRKTVKLLTEMSEHHADDARVNDLIGQVEAQRDQVMALQPAFKLVETLNQTGTFNRHRADRRIFLSRRDGQMTPKEIQKEQIQRDTVNVTWLGDAAEALGGILDDTVAACEGKPKRTRDPVREEDHVLAGSVTGSGASRSIQAATVRAVICVDPALSGLGVARDLSLPVHQGRNALQLTLARLTRCRKLSGVTIAGRDVEDLKRLVGDPRALGGLAIEFLALPAEQRHTWDPATIRGARLWSSDSWRGGLGNLTCYDEELWSDAASIVLEVSGSHAAMVVGADWSLIDPALCDQMIERYQELPRANRVTFSQAAPGLAPCIVDQAMLKQFKERRSSVGSFASVGGVLGYVPTAPSADLIAKPMCLQIATTVRDCLHRCTFDLPSRTASILAALSSAGLDPLTTTAEQAAAAVTAWWQAPTRDRSRHVVLRAIDETGTMQSETVGTLLRQLGSWVPLSTVTFAGDASLSCGRGKDLLDHPNWRDLVSEARSTGIGAIQLRTTLRAGDSELDGLLHCGAEVIGVDLVADDAETYERLTGAADFAATRSNLKKLMTLRSPEAGGVPNPWVIPRLTRRDDVYEKVEGFFDYWLLMAGWAVLDPLPRAIPGERIEPLPLPSLAAKRRAMTRVVFGPQGRPDSGADAGS